MTCGSEVLRRALESRDYLGTIEREISLDDRAVAAEDIDTLTYF